MSSCIDGLNLHPESVHDAVVALDAVTERLVAAGDPRAAFADVYGIVTRAVAAEVARRGGVFVEPAWISRLAGRFCARYLETLRASERRAAQDCGAWRVAYATTASRLTPPVQGAMLGFNAHINYDLVFGIHATILEHGHGGDRRMLARLKHDHDQVNTLLRRSAGAALARLADRHGCPVSAFFRDTAPEFAVWIAMEMLSRWREHVWRDVLAMLAARGAGERAAVARRVDQRSTRIAQMLALPSIHLAAEGSASVLSRAA